MSGEVLTKEQLKMILDYAPVHGKAWILFLASSGARGGEAIQLGMKDLCLDVDPPYANIRAKYTMKRRTGRRVWFSYETQNALKEWFKVKEAWGRKLPSGELFPEDRDMVFGFSMGSAHRLWRNALKKAGLDITDPSSEKRFYVYRMFTLRKFFRMNMAIAGMPDEIVHALMGHKAYLTEAFSPEEIAGAYKKHMHAVSIYEAEEEEPVE